MVLFIGALSSADAGAAARQAAIAAAAAFLLAFLPLALFFELNPNKMTAGVFRHGDLSSSADARILYNRDGKTATVHLVRYGDATSIRTNGKSDGSINMDRDGPRGSDEITMTLTAAIPLSLKPESKSAAVIAPPARCASQRWLAVHSLRMKGPLPTRLAGVCHGVVRLVAPPRWNSRSMK